MKSTNLFLLLLLSSLASPAFAQQPVPLSKLTWLDGTWLRQSSNSTKSAVEVWYTLANSELRGAGMTVQGPDTLITERLSIVTKGKDTFYVADVPENKKPVFFKITEWTTNGFTCENPNHDFPKKLVYQYTDKQLSVVISGDGKSKTFTFEKIDMP